MRIYYDLHIHSVLSPCAEDEMTPNNIVNMAWLKGLKAIAITDHNQCGNLDALQELAAQKDILLIPGMEIESKEGVHLLCYFKKIEDAKEIAQKIYGLLPDIDCTSFFGKQQIMNSKDEEVSRIKKLLISSLPLSVQEIAELVREKDAILGYAHIFRTSNGVISVLGFIPEEPELPFVEINESKKEIDSYNQSFRIISNSDAHRLVDISEAVNFIDIDEITIDGIFKYIGGS